MDLSVSGRGGLRALAAAGALAVALAASSCGVQRDDPSSARAGAGSSRSPAPGSQSPTATRAPCGAGSALAPQDGAWFGVSIDWSHDTLPAYAERLGHDPAVAVTFADMPLRDLDRRNVQGAVDQAAAVHSGLLLTLEPQRGLGAVTPAAISDLTSLLRRYNASGVPIIVRFAHEMNGSWYTWGQQPRRYVRTFRAVADAVHRGAPGSAMMWAPSYGGGYPFAGGAHVAKPGSADARVLDTDGDGQVDPSDDSYRPYYPGDRYVDWVGLSLYHWGTTYPWGENEVPAAGKLADQLTGRFHGPGTDERVVPDFYGTYGTRHGKPVAISETAALYAPHARGGAPERAVKSAWWRQVFAPDLLARFPRLKLVDWFEWDKREVEIGARVDWGVTREPALLAAFQASLPGWLRYGQGCRR